MQGLYLGPKKDKLSLLDPMKSSKSYEISRDLWAVYLTCNKMILPSVVIGGTLICLSRCPDLL